MLKVNESVTRRLSSTVGVALSSSGPLPTDGKISEHETMSTTDWDIFLNYGSRMIKYKRDEICLKEGESQNDLFQITSGGVRIEKNGKVVAKLPSGAIFGELSFLNWYSAGVNATASANVVADSKKVEMVVLDGQYLSGALAPNSRLRSCFFVYLCNLLVSRLQTTLKLMYEP